MGVVGIYTGDLSLGSSFQHLPSPPIRLEILDTNFIYLRIPNLASPAPQVPHPTYNLPHHVTAQHTPPLYTIASNYR